MKCSLVAYSVRTKLVGWERDGWCGSVDGAERAGGSNSVGF